MKDNLPKKGVLGHLRIVVIIMGLLCIVVAAIMTYHGEIILIGSIHVSAGLAFLTAGLVLIIASLVVHSKQKHQQAFIMIWYVILPVLIVFLIVYVSTRYSLRGDDKYTVLVDLILIMLAVTGMIGYITYRWISRGVSERVESVLKEGQTFTKAQVELNMGFWYYSQYRAEIERIKEMHNVWKKLSKIQSDQEDKEDYEPERGSADAAMTCLKQAIGETTIALKLSRDLPEDKYERFICTCKNNLAYHLAEKKRKYGQTDEGEEKLAVEYAIFAWERIQKYPDRKVAWAHTYKFVTEQFPSKFN